MAPFSYEDLPVGEREIRLIKLLPAHQDVYDSPLEAEIIRASLTDCPNFAALSYVWGPANNNCDISISIRSSNNAVVKGYLTVSHNLAVALRRLRQRTTPEAAEQVQIVSFSISLPLWIDQISINQADNAEKSRQIPLMTDIYGLSTMTIGWLGESDDTATALSAMTYLHEIGMVGVNIGLNTISPQQYNMLHILEDPDDASISTMHADDDAVLVRERLLTAIHGRGRPWDLDAKEPILKLCALPYFTRGWIQQEVAIPRRLVFQWSLATIDSEAFGAAILFIQLHVHHSLGAIRRAIASTNNDNRAASRTIDEVLLSFKPLDRFVAPCMAIRRQYQLNRSVRFFNMAFLLRKYRHLSFTEHKDRIWGLLGLANDANEVKASVDVRLTWQQTFVRAARYCISKPVQQNDWLGGMNVLALASYKSRALVSTGASAHEMLPSWVPDYRGLPTSLTIAEQTIHFLDRPFRASPVLHTEEAEIDVEIGREDAKNVDYSQILKVRGTIVDTILKVGPLPSPWASQNGINRALIRRPLLALQDLVDESCNIVSSSNAASRHPFRDSPTRLSEAAWRVPILDSEFTTTPTTSRRATLLSKACLQAYLAGSLNNCHVTSEQVMNFEEQLYPFATRSSFLGERGFVGMSSPWIKEGDLLVVLNWAMVPFILRRVNENGDFTLIGEAFCDGLMDGEGNDVGPTEVLLLV